MESQPAHSAYPRTTPSPPTKAMKVRAYALSPCCFLCHDFGEKEARVLAVFLGAECHKVSGFVCLARQPPLSGLSLLSCGCSAGKVKVSCLGVGIHTYCGISAPSISPQISRRSGLRCLVRHLVSVWAVVSGQAILACPDATVLDSVPARHLSCLTRLTRVGAYRTAYRD